MDKYNIISAFNKWLSPIHLEKLSNSAQKEISSFDAYRKKLDFKALLSLLLYAINEEKESLRDLSAALIHGSLTLTNRKSIRKAREGLFFLSNLSVIFCVT